MHIAEGVLSAPVLFSGAVMAAAGIAAGLRRLDAEQTVACGVLAAVFFVGSLIHVPIGVGNAHLILSGLLGIFLGWASFPAIFVALLLQAILFQYGGITTLGVNTFTMGCAAVASWHVFHGLKHGLSIKIAAFAAGFTGVFLSALLTAGALAFTEEGFRAAAAILFLAHLPVMLAEGLIAMFTISFIMRMKPKMLENHWTKHTEGKIA